jgi:hypothetical protein
MSSDGANMSSDRDDQEGRLRTELIEEERKLSPIRDKISEAEKEFDLQLEALDRNYEVQDIRKVIAFHNGKSEHIRKALNALSAALEENEQRLREAMAEAEKLNEVIEKAKGDVELDRRVAMAPLYDSLHHAQARLRLERKARVRKSVPASPARNKTTDNAKSQIRYPSGFPPHTKKAFPNTAPDSAHEVLPKKHLSESPYLQRGPRPTTHLFTQPSITSNDIAQKVSQQVQAINRDRLSWPESEDLMNHENGDSGPAQQTRVRVVEQEAGSAAIYGSLESGEQSATSSILTSLNTSPIDPYTNSGSSPLGGYHGSEVIGEPIKFTISNGVYTSPECMKGVPVAKIVEGDSYWDSNWTEMED